MYDSLPVSQTKRISLLLKEIPPVISKYQFMAFKKKILDLEFK